MQPPKKLVDLDPHWVEDEGRICGISFECPEHATPEVWCRQFVPFTPDMAGKEVKTRQKNEHIWKRVGGSYNNKEQMLEGFADLSLSPSVKSGCGWHGFVTDGVVTCCGDSK